MTSVASSRRVRMRRGISNLVGFAVILAFPLRATALAPTVPVERGASWANTIELAQFRLPGGLGKIGGRKDVKPSRKEVEPSGESTPTISLISPTSAPPGGAGEVVITAAGVNENSEVRGYCQEGSIKFEKPKFEAPDKLRARVRVPVEAGEGDCQVSVTSGRQGRTSEPVKFRISASASMPQAIELTFMGEGDMSFMDLMTKMQESMTATAGRDPMKRGDLRLSSDGFDFEQDGKVLFSAKKAEVKEVAEVTMMGQRTGMFRIVLRNGKIYNLGSLEGDDEKKHQTFLVVKKRLGR